MKISKVCFNILLFASFALCFSTHIFGMKDEGKNNDFKITTGTVPALLNLEEKSSKTPFLRFFIQRISPCGRYLVVAGKIQGTDNPRKKKKIEARICELYDLEKKTKLFYCKNKSKITSLDICCHGTRIAIGDTKARVIVHDKEKKAILFVYKHSKQKKHFSSERFIAPMSIIGLSNNGDYVCSCFLNHVVVHNIKAGIKKFEVLISGPNVVHLMCESDVLRLAVLGDHCLAVYDLCSGNRVHVVDGYGMDFLSQPFSSIGLSGNGQYISHVDGRSAKVYDAQEHRWKELRVLYADRRDCGLFLTRCGMYLILLMNKQFEVYDLSTQKRICSTRVVYPDNINQLVVSSDGSTISALGTKTSIIQIQSPEWFCMTHRQFEKIMQRRDALLKNLKKLKESKKYTDVICHCADR